MRTSKQQFFWIAAFFVILSAGWAGCTKSGSSYTTSPVTYVSVMNMAPYAPTVDIYLNDTLATGNSGIASGAFSTKYGALRPGKYSVKFTKNGNKDSVLDQIPSSLFDTLNFYTLILYNDPVSKAAKGLYIHDDFTGISQGNANFRFFNLSPDAPNVDLALSNTVVQSNRTPIDNGNNAGFQSTAPNSYNIQVKVAGKDSVLAHLDNYTLVGGNVYTILLGGTNNSSGNNLKINVLQAAY